MKFLSVFLLLLCTLVVASGCARVSLVYGSGGTASTLAETVGIYVNCTSSRVTVGSTILSGNTSLVHFPSSLNMDDYDLLNVTGVLVAFARNQSSLVYIFNDTDVATAKSIADAVTSSMGTAFQTSFSFVSTGASGSEVNVTYSGPGETNLVQYTQSLMTSNLNPSLGGVSSTFLPICGQTSAVTGMVGTKDVGTFNWTYSMLVTYSTSIPAGSGNHDVDILSLLNVGSLAPSSFAYSTGTYASDVAIYVFSDSTVSYVSSQPGPPTSGSRGWLYYPLTNEVIGMFSFGNDASSVSELKFTFSGTVLSEFSPAALLLAIMLTASIALMSGNRMRKMKSETTPVRR